MMAILITRYIYNQLKSTFISTIYVWMYVCIYRYKYFYILTWNRYKRCWVQIKHYTNNNNKRKLDKCFRRIGSDSCIPSQMQRELQSQTESKSLFVVSSVSEWTCMGEGEWRCYCCICWYCCCCWFPGKNINSIKTVIQH